MFARDRDELVIQKPQMTLRPKKSVTFHEGQVNFLFPYICVYQRTMPTTTALHVSPLHSAQNAYSSHHCTIKSKAMKLSTRQAMNVLKI